MHHHLIALTHEIRVWLDFWRATGDPRALVMAQVVALIALKKPGTCDEIEPPESCD